MTTTDVEAPLLRMPIPKGERSGVDADSFIMIDKITTIRRSSVDKVIGQLGATQLLELEGRIAVFLGLAR
jgi:mRNA interferase MazF